jgi:hypothetical protein
MNLRIISGWLTAFAASIIATTSGCHSSSGTLSRAPVAYLDVIVPGNRQSVVIDEGSPVAVEADQHERSRFTVEPGKHRVRVIGVGGAVVFDREVLVSDEQILEIKIP